MATLAERFWRKVERRGPDECWPWLAATNGRGYGKLMTGSRTDDTRALARSNRLAYELSYGAVPPGMDVLHKCDNPPCCNPGHLFPGTHVMNMADMRDKGRARASRLSPSEIAEVRWVGLLGLSQGRIGRIYGVSQTLVSQIITGKVAATGVMVGR